MTEAEILLKQPAKDAVWELTQEKREEFSDLIAEIVEDAALARAMHEGALSERVSRADVLNILSRPA